MQDDAEGDEEDDEEENQQGGASVPDWRSEDSEFGKCMPQLGAWLKALGSTFRAISRLRVAPTNPCPHIDAAVFRGLSACSQLTRLELMEVEGSFQPWYWGEELECCPEQLRRWLPHVRQLLVTAREEMLTFVEGLGPQLEVLELGKGDAMYCNDDVCNYMADILPDCQQLQRIAVFRMSQAMLVELVRLPRLTHVATQGLEDP